MTTANTIPTQGNEVKYRKAKLWQIILIAFNAFNGMAAYFLIGLASYSASIGYGIATLVVGGLLTFTRIFDAVTDPLLAFHFRRCDRPAAGLSVRPGEYPLGKSPSPDAAGLGHPDHRPAVHV